ncbi:glycerophosphodiester phosphodiesterase family protein [Thermoflavifilum thermophilum]|uniref:Glycerophosphoryl diester phosphodiesterase n=1 Tax=Thermoflavifilum thermophilum TaxID=1393122 RepID=A0A1I7MZK7_9BACT|nr:glycerophosphodiester phosphodiesterase family protein [Thermoflavifilum thermophilum]SFV27775.1 glycerophosphoryl diester phosphodiesterase [Thermoflavifilum thermophilum]
MKLKFKNYYKENLCLLYFIIILTLLLGFKSLYFQKIKFYKVGHRGARGLIPENTIPSFKKAIEVGANTIEFDVHITKDGKVIIYHDASFNPDYTLKPDSTEIKQDERKTYTFYQMNYNEIRRFIIGVKKYKDFPYQELTKTYVPLLTEMIDSIEIFTKKYKYPKVTYLLEIKSDANTDGFEQPPPERYVEILMSQLRPYLTKLKDRLFIQSFDIRPLKILHKRFPDIRIGYLTSDKLKKFDQNISELGFKPDLYNPNFRLVNMELVEKCHSNNIKIFPWTVNDSFEINRLINMHVDGIITDYPNFFNDKK